MRTLKNSKDVIIKNENQKFDDTDDVQYGSIECWEVFKKNGIGINFYGVISCFTKYHFFVKTD